MSKMAAYRREWFSNIRADILSGIVVALALIPEAIGFSVIAGVDPKVGLYASFAIACVSAFVGGRPGMISAATAATAVLMVTLVKEHGLQYLFAATILMGLIQIGAGALRLGRLMNFVSRSVITGFVNALAILIFMAQLPQLIGVPTLTYAMIAAGLAIIYLLPYLTKAIPSPLVAIAVLTAIAWGFGLNLRTVGDLGELPSGLPVFALPQVPLTFETLRIIFPYSVALAAVGLLESLLTAQIVDDMTETGSNKSQECYGQGASNIASALIGGMGGCAMIGQSGINVTSGGRGRLSTFVAGAFLLFLIVVLDDLVADHPDGRPRRRDDHGLDRHLLMALHPRPAPQPAAIVHRHAGDRHRQSSPRMISPRASSSACCCQAYSSPARSRGSSPSISATAPTGRRATTSSGVRSSSPRPRASSRALPSTSRRNG
jgi:SulP family sulfate permease